MYSNDEYGGMLVKSNNEVSDYLNKLYTGGGKYSNGINFQPKCKSIVANNVVGYHLYKLFNLEQGEIVTIVNSILDSICIKEFDINNITVDVIIIMLENEIIKVLKHIYNYDDNMIKNHSSLGIIINTIKCDLLFIANNF